MGYRWSDWVENACRGLGYASETSISKLNTSPGRSTKQNFSPDYEPDPLARRFDDALKQIPVHQQNLVKCHFLGMSDSMLQAHEPGYKTRWAARWAVQKALQAIRRAL